MLKTKNRPPLHVMFLFVSFFINLSFLSAQGSPDMNHGPAPGGTPGAISAETDPAKFVGATLSDLIRSLGVPRSVYAVRGIEEWQDDVVFVYEQGDFYIFKDRVWQIAIKSARGIKAGDTRGAVTLVLGSAAESRGNSVFYPINEYAWPLMLRGEFDSSGRINIIFIYRKDF